MSSSIDANANSGGKLLLECRSVTKSYSGHVVLDAVDFSVKPGEVHALVGENGAGKSTLIKIITGATLRDSGEMVFDGSVVPVQHTRRDAEELGIAVIYQELSLIPGMTVAQNIFLGKEPLIKGLGLIDAKRMNAMAAELIARYDFPLKPTDIIDTISIAQRQLVEILKALSGKAGIMIMDEPTSSLTKTEVELLFLIIATLKSEGISVLYISHRMEEVYALSDRVTGLRDGKLVKVLEKEEISPAEIIRLMIGHKLDETAVQHKLERKEGKVVLEVRGLTAVGKFQDLSFDLHEGEVLGIGLNNTRRRLHPRGTQAPGHTRDPVDHPQHRTGQPRPHRPPRHRQRQGGGQALRPRHRAPQRTAAEARAARRQPLRRQPAEGGSG
jgi:ribose transport system ATP-binding protein